MPPGPFRAPGVDPCPQADRVREVPDYSDFIRVEEGAEDAHRWGWAWPGEEGEVRPVEVPLVALVALDRRLRDEHRFLVPELA